MTAPRLTDAELSAALRRAVPARAQQDLRDRIAGRVASTPQQRPLPPFLAALGDADPLSRRRALLLAATLLLALSLSLVLVAGALLNRQPRISELTLDPPADPIAFVQSAYSKMPDLPPLSLTAVENGVREIRVHVDAFGSVRVERYPSLEATEPESYTIYSGTSIGELIPFDGRSWWHEQTGAIQEDPRVFVYAAIGQAGWGPPTAGCSTVLSDPSLDAVAAARGIQYIGAEYVLGRPTYRFRCVGDRWVDIETRLVLRSEGPATDRGVPIPGQVDRIEVIELDFGQPPAELFELAPPRGVRLISEEDHQCAQDPYCLTPARSVPVPSPAPEAGTVPEDLDALAEGTAAASEALPAYEALFRQSNTKYPGHEQRVHFDGSGRYRFVVRQESGGFGDESVTLAGPDGGYQSGMREDGITVWYRTAPGERPASYPLSIGNTCAGGWTHSGVDLIAGRVADRILCPDHGTLYWIDRELGFVVRLQGPTDERYGTEIVELTELRFGDQPDELFELPAGAVVDTP